LFEQTIPFDLPASLGSFDVVAGEPSENAGLVVFDPVDFDLGHGRIALRPEDITFTPDPQDDDKGRVSFQTSISLQITAFVAAPEDLATVCVDGEQYGPFEVKLDAFLFPTSVSPSGLPLSSETLALIGSGGISFCLRVVAPVNGTVLVEGIPMTLGL